MIFGLTNAPRHDTLDFILDPDWFKFEILDPDWLLPLYTPLTTSGALICRGLAVKDSLARHYRSRANRPHGSGVPYLNPGGVGWVRI